MLYDGLGHPHLISFIYRIHSAILIQRWWRNRLFRKIISERIIQKEIVLR
mgnify:CR=1 FL=1|jgi:hypothetical protein